MKKYSLDLKSVEINCTRYSKLKPTTCLKWTKMVPNDFTFTIKAPLYITHNKKLNDFQEWWTEFAPCINAFGDKFRCILFQFSPSFLCNEKNISKIINMKKIIPEKIKCAFEFRDLSWFNNNLTEDIFIQNFTQVILVIPEIRNSDTNFGNLPGGIHIGFTNSDFIYIRFHGSYDYSCGTYNEKLKEYKYIIDEISHKKSYIFAYFNNTDTWTTLPFTIMEGEFSKGVPFGRAYIPSAIYDSILFRNFFN